MANSNTKKARVKGFSSMKDMLANNDNKIFKGSACDTSWKAKACKRNGPKSYKSD